MAVDTDSQGQCLCSKLMRAVCAQADADNLPVLLETWSERNAAIYGHFGFQIVEKFGLEAEGQELFNDGFVMVRPAAEQILTTHLEMQRD